jgi:MFS family permease
MGRVYYGWIIVGLSFVVVMAGYGLLFSYAVFAPSFVEALSLDAASVSAPFSVFVATYAILGLVTGRMTDRWGPRPIILGGAVLLCCGFIVLSQATELWHLFLGMSFFVGLGMSTPYIPTSATIVRWFAEKLGQALAIVSMGSGLSIVFVPPAALQLVEWLGWRNALLILGLVCSAAMALCALGIRRDPGPILASVAGDQMLDDEVSWTLPEARRTTAFWIMCGVYFLSWGVMFFPYAHLVAVGVDMGFARTDGVGLLSAVGLAGLAGRPAIGWLTDKAGLKAGLLALQAAAFASFSQWQALSGLYTAAALFGMGAKRGRYHLPRRGWRNVWPSPRGCYCRLRLCFHVQRGQPRRVRGRLVTGSHW